MNWVSIFLLCAPLLVKCDDDVKVGKPLTQPPQPTTTLEPIPDRRRRSVPDMVGVQSPTSFTADMQTTVLKEHNDHRSAEGGNGASNMKSIEWSSVLADMAQAAADTCIFDHLNYKFNSSSTTGQNIAVFSYEVNDNIAKVASAWYEEKDNYDYDKKDCIEGKVCGNFKQMLLSRVFQMGCGIKTCSDMVFPEKTWPVASLVFCNYNRIQSDGKDPWQEGAPCSLCTISPGWKCENNLCKKCDPGTDDDCTAYTCYMDERNIDKYPASTCERYVGLGYCETKDHLMSVICGRTCKICPAYIGYEMSK